MRPHSTVLSVGSQPLNVKAVLFALQNAGRLDQFRLREAVELKPVPAPRPHRTRTVIPDYVRTVIGNLGIVAVPLDFDPEATVRAIASQVGISQAVVR